MFLLHHRWLVTIYTAIEPGVLTVKLCCNFRYRPFRLCLAHHDIVMLWLQESIQNKCKRKTMEKFALCVGGTHGIGNAIARKLASNNINVCVMGRNELAGSDLIEQLNNIYSSGKHQYIKCDAFLMKNVRESCRLISNEIPYLNYCVFTQGIVSMQKRIETVEGIDEKLALHYYSRMQYIEELLPLLRNCLDSTPDHIEYDTKVVSVLSAGEHQSYINKSDLALRRSYNLSDAANATGFYNDLMMDHYSRMEENEGISFVHINPGNVKTNWGRNLSPIQRMLAKVVQLGGISPEECAERLSKVILNPAIGAKGGFYLYNKNVEPAHTTSAHSEGWRQEVYKHTLEVLESTIKMEKKSIVENAMVDAAKGLTK